MVPALAPHVDTTPGSTTIPPSTPNHSFSTDCKSSSQAPTFLDSTLGGRRNLARGSDVPRRATTIRPTTVLYTTSSLRLLETTLSHISITWTYHKPGCS